MMEIEHIAVLGGAFDPPTKGHEDVVNQALTTFETVLLVPSVAHPFGKKMTALPHRLDMLRIFAQNWAKSPKTVEVFNIEQSMALTHPSQRPIYTYMVLQKLTKTLTTNNRKVQLHFVVGPDNLQPEVWQKFYKYKEIEKNWPLFAVKERIDIHSIEVRQKLKLLQGSPRKLRALLTPMVGDPIAQYILKHQLYDLNMKT